MLYYQNLFYIPKIIWIEFISRYHNNSLIGHFGINKIPKLVFQKYYLPILYHDIKDNMKKFNIYLALKAIWQKSYRSLQLWPIFIYC